MRRAILCMMLGFSILLVSCGTVSENGYIGGATNSDSLISDASITSGPFKLTAISEKAVFSSDEPVEIEALIEYLGENDEIEIFHAASPLWFNVTETTRDMLIGAAMNEPLITTTITKEKPFKEKYRKSGGYSAEDPNKDFVKEFLQGDTFPTGTYEIEVVADFYTEKNGEKIDYKFTTKLIIKVE